jgi:hypothetical protein
MTAFRRPCLMLSLCVSAFALVIAGNAAAQQPSQVVSELTRAERTQFQETSSYADVMSFVETVVAASPNIHVTTFGYSFEARPLPLVVVGDVADASPEAVRASGKVPIYLQGNIHAGEVCGKEAVLMLLRELANGEHAEWFDSIVLLVAPIFNPDGNERVNLTNRGRQHGPIGGMGTRANGMDLDLNRDHMKIDSPESRSLVSMASQYDPYIMVDLHVTNGTQHAYYLTYAPPLHPSTHPAIDGLLRNDLLPTITRDLKAKHGWDYYYYGNLPYGRGGRERGWYTYDYRPRFGSNYVGLRNRIGILGEAYSYATFEDRVLASLRFVEEIANFSFRNATQIRDAVAAADAADLVGREMALRAELMRSDSVEILLGAIEEEAHPYTGRTMYRRLDVITPERLPEFQRFQPTETERVPAAYFVPAELNVVLDKLSAHGISWTRLNQSRTMMVERFALDSTVASQREYQGHRERTLFGAYQEAEVTLPEGTAVVSVEQPLGLLVFNLLEPRAADGFANWNFLDDLLEGATFHPIVRSFQR